MKKNKKIIIATDAVNLPFEFGAGTGVQGFDVDLGNEVGNEIGQSLGMDTWEVKWVKFPFEKLFDLLARGEAELVISAISVTPEREKEFAFSDPYYDSGNTIATRLDNESIRDLATLSGKKIGVQSSTTGHRFMESQTTASNVTIAKFPTLDDALGALNRTEVDAVVGDEPIMTYSIYKSFPNLQTLGVRLTEEKYAILMRKNESELLRQVNASLARMKSEGMLEELRKKWFQDVMEQVRQEREKRRQQEALREAPKQVTFNFVKSGGAFRVDRLDGYQLRLIGSGGTFVSSPIVTDGARTGTARFGGAIPPGEYRFNMDIVGLNQQIVIPKKPSSSVTIVLTYGNTASLDIR